MKCFSQHGAATWDCSSGLLWSKFLICTLLGLACLGHMALVTAAHFTENALLIFLTSRTPHLSWATHSKLLTLCKLPLPKISHWPQPRNLSLLKIFFEVMACNHFYVTSTFKSTRVATTLGLSVVDSARHLKILHLNISLFVPIKHQNLCRSQQFQQTLWSHKNTLNYKPSLNVSKQVIFH